VCSLSASAARSWRCPHTALHYICFLNYILYYILLYMRSHHTEVLHVYSYYYIQQSMTKEIANSIRDSDAEHAGLVEAVHSRVMARIVQQGDVAGQVHEALESKRYYCFTTRASVTPALPLLLPPTYCCFTYCFATA